MRRKLTDFCSAIQFMSCDSEVSHFVDYSKSTNKARGAELNCDTTDLPGLPIKNSDSELTITAAIFNDHCFKKEEDSAKDDEHCEGVLFPEPYTSECWNLFVELKYDPKLNGRPKDAFDQIVNTVSHLRSSLVLERDKMVYGVVCFPIASSKPPYSSSVYTPQEYRRLKQEENLVLVSTSSITILSKTKLRFS